MYGYTRLRCGRCGGNIVWKANVGLGTYEDSRVRQCLQCGRPSVESPEHFRCELCREIIPGTDEMRAHLVVQHSVGLMWDFEDVYRHFKIVGKVDVA